MIYLASPYTHDSSLIRFKRYSDAFRYTRHQMRLRATIFSPVVYGHQFAPHIAGASPYEFWEYFNNQMMLLATSVHVLQLDGWEQSRGIAHELKIADDLGIAVKYVEPI